MSDRNKTFLFPDNLSLLASRMLNLIEEAKITKVSSICEKEFITIDDLSWASRKPDILAFDWSSNCENEGLLLFSLPLLPGEKIVFRINIIYRKNIARIVNAVTF